MDVKNSRMETKGDHKKLGDTSKKMLEGNWQGTERDGNIFQKCMDVD